MLTVMADEIDVDLELVMTMGGGYPGPLITLVKTGWLTQDPR